ncbi:DUF697 domain-containing protein [Helicobacter pylori]|nr:DUF697 domain-containing protein [Helicobacter pylori]
MPTIVVFTNTQAEAGDAFVQETKGIIDEEWGLKGFVKAYVRVNSVKYLSDDDKEILIKGLEELVAETEKCLSDAMKNHFLRVQKVKIQERKQAMIAKSKKIIHVASGLAGAAGASPIPFSDAFAIAPIQAGMIYEMNDAFEVSLGKSATPTFIREISSIIALAHVERTLINGFLKSTPIGRSVAEGATAAVITEGIGFAYLKVLEKCFNDETGEVNLPGEVGMITSLFKENCLNLDTIKQLTLKP